MKRLIVITLPDFFPEEADRINFSLWIGAFAFEKTSCRPSLFEGAVG